MLATQNINEQIQQYVANDSKLDLQDILKIIKEYLPVYPSLKKITQDHILNLLSNNFIAFSQLVNFTSLLVKDKKKEAAIYKKVLVDVIWNKPKCLSNFTLSTTKSRIELQNLKSLFFGSKIFNLIHDQKDIISYLEILVIHWSQMKGIKEKNPDIWKIAKISDLLLSFFTLHATLAPSLFFERFVFTQKENTQYFIDILKNSSILNSKRIVSNHLLPYFDSIISNDSYKEIFKILKIISISNYLEYKSFRNGTSLIFQLCILKSVSESLIPTITLNLFDEFKNYTELTDERLCQLLAFVISNLLDDEHKEKLSGNTLFVNGVTKRLGNQDKEIRERTMFIAKLLTNGKIEYESDFKIEYPNIVADNISYSINDIVFEKLFIKNDNNSSKMEYNIPTQSLTKLSLDDADSDDDDEFTEERADIVFLKDLLALYEKIDDNKNLNRVKLFKMTIKLVRQKKDFGSEVNYFASALFTNIASLNNEFDEKDFESWRINALVSIIIVVPEKVVDFIKFLFTTELSLQQRFSILSSLGLGARELRGISDFMVVKPIYDFPTQRLPWDKENPEGLIHENRNIQRIEEISNTQVIASQITTWRSKKLLNNNFTKTINNFRKVARLFFYPLAHGWLNGIDQGTYDNFFKTHYYNTLSIIYKCADPVYDYETMTQMMQRITGDAMEQQIPIEVE